MAVVCAGGVAVVSVVVTGGVAAATVVVVSGVVVTVGVVSVGAVTVQQNHGRCFVSSRYQPAASVGSVMIFPFDISSF